MLSSSFFIDLLLFIHLLICEFNMLQEFLLLNYTWAGALIKPFFLPSTFTSCISVNVWQLHTVNLFVRNFFLVSKMCSSRADCCVCSAGCLHFSLWCFQWIQWINLLKTFCKYLFLNEGNNVMFFLLIVINQLIKSQSTKM